MNNPVTKRRYVFRLPFLFCIHFIYINMTYIADRAIVAVIPGKLTNYGIFHCFQNILDLQSAIQKTNTCFLQKIQFWFQEYLSRI